MFIDKVFNLFTLYFLCFLLFPLSCFSQTRKPAVAGQFYPSDSSELNSFIDKSLSDVKMNPVSGDIIAVLAPHAGYDFSGKVAAYSYKLISGQKYDTVVILGSAHTMFVKGAAVYSRGFFETPLGKVQVDEELSKILLSESDVFEDNIKAHLMEHSIEVQIPFLQKALKPDFKILPIVMNSENMNVLTKIGEILAKHLKGKKAIIVISSDLSHYPTAAVANKVDNTSLLALRTMDPEYFHLSNAILLNRGEKGLSALWCGESAVIAALIAAKKLGANNSTVLKYANSYDINPEHGNPDKVVGYASVAFTRDSKAKPLKIVLDKKQKTFLLKLARETISLRIEGKQKEDKLSDDYYLNLPGAVFVTITKNGNLRGCIGTIEPNMTIYDAVIYAANSAAFNDSRFSPLTKDELEKVKIEISLLSPLRQVSNINEIIPHKHGVLIVKGERSGLFLPQVWDKITDKENFLNEICAQKAGLEINCWKDSDSKIYIFTVDSFEEK